jgi:hypothetical protein
MKKKIKLEVIGFFWWFGHLIQQKKLQEAKKQIPDLKGKFTFFLFMPIYACPCLKNEKIEYPIMMWILITIFWSATCISFFKIENFQKMVKILNCPN